MIEFDYEANASRQRLLREQGALALAFDALKYFVDMMEAQRKRDAESGSATLVRAARLCALVNVSVIARWVSVAVHV